MDWPKDLKSKAKKGKYFPITFGEAVRIVKQNSLINHYGDRIKIRMKNEDHENDYGFLIAVISPKEYLTLYSVSEDLPIEFSENMVLRAIHKLAKVQEPKKGYYKNEYSHYCAYLDRKNETCLRVTKKDVSVQISKYRGSDKLSSYKAKNKIQETELT